MTVDSALMKCEGYKTKLFEDVVRIGEYEYVRAALQYKVVDKGELCAETYQMLYIDYRDQLAEEALERGDHLMYGMNRVDFIIRFTEQDGFDGNSVPFIRQQEFREAFELFIKTKKLVVFSYDDIENSPIQEVW